MKLFLALAILATYASCNRNPKIEEPYPPCLVPPPRLYLSIVDDKTGEDYFIKNNLSKDDVEIWFIDSKGNKQSVDLNDFSDSKLKSDPLYSAIELHRLIFYSSGISWGGDIKALETAKDFFLKVGDKTLSLHLDEEATTTEHCGTSYFIKSFKIDGKDVPVKDGLGIYRL